MVPSRSMLLGLMCICLGLVIYHLSLRLLPSSVPAVAVVAAAYLVAGTGLTLFLILRRADTSVVPKASMLPWALALGTAVCLIELGYVAAYRGGLPVSLGNVLVLGLVTVLLFPIGTVFLHEPITLRRSIGLALVVAGVLAMSGPWRE